MKIVIKFVMLVLSTASIASAALVDLSKSGSIDSIGDTVWINLSVSGLTSNPLDSISGFDVDLTFDSTVLKFTGYSFINPSTARNELDLPGALLPFIGEASETLSGRVDIVGISGNTASQLDALQAESFAVVRLQFEALAILSSLVRLDLSDPNLLFSDSTSGVADIVYRTPLVIVDAGQVSAVPEVSAASLIPLAVLFLAGLRARRRAIDQNRSSVSPLVSGK